MAATLTRLRWQEFARIKDEPNRHELIRGELVTMPPPGTYHGFLAHYISARLAQYVEPRGWGVVLAAETGFLLETDPDTVRAADVAYLAMERWEAWDREGYFPGAPDFVVEVLSPSDMMQEVEDKIDAWLAAGTRLVWLVNPRRKSVTSYRPDQPPALAAAGASISADAVVEGFSLDVASIFA